MIDIIKDKLLKIMFYILNLQTAVLITKLLNIKESVFVYQATLSLLLWLIVGILIQKQKVFLLNIFVSLLITFSIINSFFLVTIHKMITLIIINLIILILYYFNKSIVKNVKINYLFIIFIHLTVTINNIIEYEYFLMFLVVIAVLYTIINKQKQ